MFGRKKKETPSSAQAGQMVSGENLERIRTMPDRFYLVPHAGTNRTFVILGVVLIVVGILVAAALALWKFGPTPPQGTPAASPVPGVTETPSPVPSPTPVVTSSPVVPAPSPTPEPTPVPTAAPTPTPTDIPLGSSDADKDDLTFNEERLYGTSPENADSDGDGYADGAEVRRGYSPHDASGLTLVADGYFRTSQTALGFRWDHPAAWQVSESNEGGVATVRLDSRLGESITAVRYPNEELLTLEAWLAEQGITDTEDVTLNGRSAKSRRDVPGYFFSPPDGTAVIALNYDWLGSGQSSFVTTFAAVVNSLRFP